MGKIIWERQGMGYRSMDMRVELYPMFTDYTDVKPGLIPVSWMSWVLYDNVDRLRRTFEELDEAKRKADGLINNAQSS